MAQKEYLKMADVFEGGVTLSNAYVRAYYSDSNSELNWGAMMAGYAAHAINSHDELVSEVDRLRGALSASMSALYEVERVTSELIKNGCYVVDDINAEVSYSIKLVEAIEE